MAFCACAMGFAIGRFPQLQMQHILPAGRLKREYLVRLAEEASFSLAVLQSVWDKQMPTGHLNKFSLAKSVETPICERPADQSARSWVY